MEEMLVTRLENGQTFPDLQLPLVGGGTLSLPGDLAGSYGVVLVYRGSWCPYCNAQLGAFSRAKDSLDAAGVRAVALSVDDEATSSALVEKRHLTFPVAHSADADQVAATLGSYVNDEPRYLQSTGFVLAPDGSVVTAVYSSGAIGRLVPEDVVGLVTYLKDHS
jgi:peroxiredoxin